MSLLNGYALFAGIYDEDRAGHAGHITDSAQVFLKLFLLVHELDNFLFGQQVDLTCFFHALDVAQSVYSGLDRLEVSEHTAEPSVGYVILTAALSLCLDGLLRLLFRTYKKNRLAFHCYITNKEISLFNLLHCLLQVDDVDAVALCEDELLHLRVPSARLMTKVYASFEKLLHRNY